ncbi:hypothetical protein SG34_010490 [Thalassomonas viridans]|uniref:Histidine kinase domain-containing protein n=2 Tax=Thalassomonas viridans TaxID=137584 RepID=A0AAF0CCD1_9GAMM|nr:hypothetical protein SG34_010490 [Thalassomonas viridans]
MVLMVFTRAVAAGEMPAIPLPLTITQANDSIMWIGTQNRLLRYDGQHLIDVVKTKDHVFQVIPIDSDVIYATDKKVVYVSSQLQQSVLFENPNILSVASQGDDLHILTNKHLLTFSRSKQKIIRKLEQANSYYYSKIALENNYLCINLVNSISCHHLLSDKKKSYPYKRVTELIAHNNKLYAINDSGLIMIDYQQQFSKVLLASGKLGTLASSKNKRYLWLEQNQYLKKYDLIENRFVRHQYSRPGNARIYDIYETNDGVIWLASTQLEKLVRSSISQSDVGIPANTGMAWLVKHKGQMIGADTFGLIAIDVDQGTSRLLTDINEQIGRAIFTAYSTDAYIWLGGINGFYRIDIDDSKVDNLINKLPFHIVMCIKEYDQNRLLVCMDNGQVSLVNIHTLEVEHMDIAATSETIDSAFGYDNSLWFARSGGLQHKVKGNKESHLLLNQFTFMQLHSSQYSPRKLYAGTQEDGLYRIDQDDHLQTEYFDMSYIGERIHDIAEYGKNIWLTSILGLAKLNQEDDQLSYYPINKSVGRILNDGGNFYAIAGDGNLVSWGSDTQERIYNSKIILSQLLVDGVMQSELKKVTDGSLVELRVFLNDYNHTGNHKFSFNVNNNGWRQFDNDSDVTFKPELGPNRIRVKAVDERDQHLETYFDFEVIRPWYLSWTAYFIYLMLFFHMCLLAFMKYRNKKQYQTKMVKRLYEKHHHHTAGDLAADLVPRCKVIEILIDSGHIEEAKNNLNDMQEHIVLESHQSAASQLKTDDLYKGVQYLATVEGYRTNAEINIDIPKFAYKPDLYIPGCTKYIYTIIYQALNNAIEHSSASNIKVSVKTFHNSIEVKISDDGRGFSPKILKSPGLGFYEMKAIASMLKTRLDVSTSEQGTEVKLVIPIRRSK